MNKFERKARLKAMKRAAKEAKRNRHAQAAEAAGAIAQPADSAAGIAQDPASDARPQLAAVEAPTTPIEEEFILRDKAQYADLTLGAARNQAQAAGEGDIREAEQRAMLAKAARLTDQVIDLARATLAEVPLPRLREAYEIVKATPEPAEGNAQKRPRRGSDPIVSLVKTALAAASLMTRIIGKLNPMLGRARKAA